jgi:hypothetical protein
MSDDILQRDHKTYRGKILYTSKKPERMDQERGREYFMINVHANGKRTMIAHCEIDDRPAVMRDITYSLDKNWMPMDCFVRISVNDDFMGSGWFNCTDDSIECEAFTKLEERVSQEMKTLDRKPPHSFQNHAIAADALHFQMLSADGLPEAHPPYDVWCTNDENYIWLCGGVAGYMQTWYELVELEIDG